MINNFENMPEKYRHLLARTSVRRFDPEPLDAESLRAVQKAVKSARPIQKGHNANFLAQNEPPKNKLTVAQGPYGRFIVSSHFMIPYTEKNKDSLVELGFQSQQVVMGLQELNLGSCYVGAHGRVRKLQQEFGLSDNTHLAAVLIYGKPAGSELSKSLDQSYRALVGSRKRKEIDDILIKPVPQNTAMPTEWQTILEAGRWAPSATNAQPWRILPIDDHLQLFTNPAAYPIVLSAGSKLMYALYDAGIIMANIILAAQALGVTAKWTVQHDTRIPNQKALIPIARLSFG